VNDTLPTVHVYRNKLWLRRKITNWKELILTSWFFPNGCFHICRQCYGAGDSNYEVEKCWNYCPLTVMEWVAFLDKHKEVPYHPMGCCKLEGKVGWRSTVKCTSLQHWLEVSLSLKKEGRLVQTAHQTVWHTLWGCPW
jgi:hypothetical protein